MIENLRKKITDFRLKRGFRVLSNYLISMRSRQTVVEIIDFLFSEKAVLITPWQFKSEITSLFTLYETLDAKNVLEIGTANGGTLFGHCRLANEKATIISIDLPDGQYGGGYPDWKVPIYKNFAKKNQALHLIRASSHDVETISQVQQILKGQQLDYLFIDGDHSYEGVKKDFELYHPFVKKGGIIIFHDIVAHIHSSCKVDQFWKEIKFEFKHVEFIDSPSQECYGVGVLYND